MHNVKFSERLKKYRVSRGLSQLELGELIGVSNRAVSKWERGEAYPTFDTLGALARALGILVDDLVPSSKELKKKKIYPEWSLSESFTE